MSNKVTTCDHVWKDRGQGGGGRNKLYFVDLALFLLSIFLLAKQNVFKVTYLKVRLRCFYLI